MAAGKVNLKNVADDVIDLTEALAKHGVAIRNKIPASTPQVRGRALAAHVWVLWCRLALRPRRACGPARGAVVCGPAREARPRGRERQQARCQPAAAAG